MPKYKISADASFYYREDTRADVARMDSSAVCGNLADAMKNATVLFPPPQIIQMVRKTRSLRTRMIRQKKIVSQLMEAEKIF